MGLLRREEISLSSRPLLLAGQKFSLPKSLWWVRAESSHPVGLGCWLARKLAYSHMYGCCFELVLFRIGMQSFDVILHDCIVLDCAVVHVNTHICRCELCVCVCQIVCLSIYVPDGSSLSFSEQLFRGSPKKSATVFVFREPI